jgi:hypothetical protein
LISVGDVGAVIILICDLITVIIRVTDVADTVIVAVEL